MGVYDLYRARTQCSTSESTLKQDGMEQQIKDNFESQPNYHQVYLNTDLATLYKVLIAKGNTKDKVVGYKILTSYPYDTYVFDSGDYITWTYGGETSVWLLTSIDKTYLYNVNARIRRCNNDLKWIDSNGEIPSYKCVVYDEIEVSIKDDEKLMIAEGSILVEAQSNSDTLLINENQRFIFNGKAYKTSQVINIFDNNIIRLIMELDVVNDDLDDLANNIANVNSYDYQININEESFEQIVGYTDTLTYNLTLDNEDVAKDTEWVSSDESIATIDNNGNIQLLAVGTVTFTVRMADNTDVSDTLTITVVGTLPSTESNQILPNVTNILQGDTQIYTVCKYVDNVANSDTFTITVNDITDASYYYTLNIIDGNTFCVTSLRYLPTDLIVTCTNDNDATTTSITINLKGLW